MATGTAGSTARDFHTQQTHYLKGSVVFSSANAVTLGTIPANAQVIRCYANVTTAFAGASANNVAIGNTNSGQSAVYAAAISVLSVGVKLDTTTLATCAAAQFAPTSDTVVTATFSSTGVTTTSGAATVVVEYINL